MAAGARQVYLVDEPVAAALGAELLELSDGIDRSGALGAFRSGLDAMRKNCQPLRAFQTERALGGLSAGNRGHACLGGAVQQRGAQLFASVRKKAAAGRLSHHPRQRRQVRGGLRADGPVYALWTPGGSVTAQWFRGLCLLAGGVFAAGAGTVGSVADSFSKNFWKGADRCWTN